MKPIKGQIYLVGGAIRDRLLGRRLGDHDYLVVGSTPEDLIEAGFQQVGKDFPVFLHPETKAEYALARTERKQGHGYHGFLFDFGPDISLEEDLKRRDFTINAIAEDCHGRLFDPFNGQADIKHRSLRHVSPAFAEDPVRILRLARFHATLYEFNFTIAEETRLLARQIATSGELHTLTPERVAAETLKALNSAHPSQFFLTLEDLNALEALFPELHGRWQAAANSKWIALNALQRAVGLNLNNPQRWAALLATQSKESVEHLNQRLKLPRAYTQLSLKVVNFRPKILIAAQLSAEQILVLLEHLNAFRQPNELDQVMHVVIAAEPARDNDLAQVQTTLTKALKVASEVDNKNLMDQGLQGLKLGQAIRHQRINAIQAILA